MDATNNTIDEFLGFFAESIEDLSALKANPQYVNDMLSGKLTGSGCTRASESQDHDEEGEDGGAQIEPGEGEPGSQEYEPQGEGRPATGR
jgi:hypothetical protein